MAIRQNSSVLVVIHPNGSVLWVTQIVGMREELERMGYTVVEKQVENRHDTLLHRQAS